MSDPFPLQILFEVLGLHMVCTYSHQEDEEEEEGNEVDDPKDSIQSIMVLDNSCLPEYFEK